MSWTVETLNETVDQELAEQRVVIVRAFVKKTDRTPVGEIDLALQRAKELKA